MANDTDEKLPAETKPDTNSGMEKKPEGLKQKFFCFHGRLGRKAYFLRSFSLWIISIIITIIFVSAFGLGAVSDHGAGGAHFLYGLFNKVWALITFVSMVTLNTRRLHDLNFSGWWQLLFVAPSVVAVIAVVTVLVGIGLGVTGNPAAGLTGVIGISGLLAALMCWLVTIVFQLFLLLKKGRSGDNKYGTDPLAGKD